MKFQFSIARLLAATAMVALTFGLARSMLGKEISSAVIFVAILAADLGLLVLVAQKKNDLYRILRIIVFMLGSIFGFAALRFISEGDSSSRLIGFVLIAMGISMMLLFIFFNMRIVNAELKEIKDDCKRKIQERLDAEKPSENEEENHEK